jgi:hypothetical protein
VSGHPGRKETSHKKYFKNSFATSTHKKRPELFPTILSVEPRINACSVPPYFLTCTGRLFSFCTGQTDYNVTHNIMIYLTRKYPLLGMAVSRSYLRIPILAGLLPRVNCPILRALPGRNTNPLFPLFPPTQAILYIQTTLTCPNLLVSGTGIKVVTILNTHFFYSV